MPVTISFQDNQVDMMIALIRLSNVDKELDPTDVTFDPPIAIQPTVDRPRNTSVYVTSTTSGKYLGERTFYYNRIDIQNLRYGDLVTDEHLTFPKGTAITTQDLSDKLAEVFGIRIDREMLVDEPLPSVADGDKVVTVTFNPGNFAIIGKVDVTLTGI